LTIESQLKVLLNEASDHFLREQSVPKAWFGRLRALLQADLTSYAKLEEVAEFVYID
jgi:hypothetical protein